MSIALRISITKHFFASLIFTVIYQSVVAQEVSHQWEIMPYVGVQQSRFDWSIAGNASGTNPNILSELNWKKLRGPNFGLNIKYNITDRLSVKANNAYSSITKGEVEDTDYAGDNRQDAFYFDLLNANKGYLYHGDLQISYQLLRFGQFNINPIVGLAYNQQKFHLLESAGNPLSNGLNSTYEARYKGFEFGTEFVYKTPKFNIGATILSGFYAYSSKANWNLIPDFAKPVSFTHKANSFALSGDINLSVPINKSLGIELDYLINNIKTYSGVDRAYYTSRATEETKFNGANFRKNALQLGLNIGF